ncbi:MAG: hypothetical protein RIS41_2167 [Actinomycetota bacterium]
MVGLRAAEAGLALLGLLRHRSRRLAGNHPRFLGSATGPGGHCPESGGQNQPGHQDQVLARSGVGQFRRSRRRRRSRTGTATQAEIGWEDRNVDHDHRHVTRRHVRAVADGGTLGPKRHADRTDREKDRHASIGVGDRFDRIDGSRTIGHVEHGGHPMSDEGLASIVQIRRGRNLQLRSRFVVGLGTRSAVE